MSIRGVLWVSYLAFVYGCFAFGMAQTPKGATTGAALIVGGLIGFIGAGLYLALSPNQRAV